MSVSHVSIFFSRRENPIKSNPFSVKLSFRSFLFFPGDRTLRVGRVTEAWPRCPGCGSLCCSASTSAPRPPPIPSSWFVPPRSGPSASVHFSVHKAPFLSLISKCRRYLPSFLPTDLPMLLTLVYLPIECQLFLSAENSSVSRLLFSLHNTAKVVP